MQAWNVEIAEGPFAPTLASLASYTVPDWFRDAKFGVYTHWGPLSVATARMPAGESDDWYGRYMYCPGLSGPLPDDRLRPRRTHELHRKNFGDPARFGYKDIIPLFKAEHFDAEAWADLFARSGARFAGPVAIHHDNFALWRSNATRWNAVDMGPGRDLTGELEQAIHGRGMRFLAAMHHAMTWFYFEQAHAFDAADPQYADLYCEAHAPADPDLSKDWCQVEWTPPSAAFITGWLEKCVELVDRYEVDLLWHDAALDKLPENARLAMAAHYYNRAAQRGREPVLTYKGTDLPAGTAVLDFERHAAEGMHAAPWLTDTSLGRDFWYYDAGDAGMFTTGELLCMLVEIVSKNGCLLLNVGPHPDGTIPAAQRERLLGMGQWLRANGEAIYGTRPWRTHGEGPNLRGGGSDHCAQTPYTPEDIRFTQRGDCIYAIPLAAPGRDFHIVSLGRDAGLLDRPVVDVRLLGSDQPLRWTQQSGALAVAMPGELPAEGPVAFKCVF